MEPRLLIFSIKPYFSCSFFLRREPVLHLRLLWIIWAETLMIVSLKDFRLIMETRQKRSAKSCLPTVTGLRYDTAIGVSVINTYGKWQNTQPRLSTICNVIYIIRSRQWPI